MKNKVDTDKLRKNFKYNDKQYMDLNFQFYRELKLHHNIFIIYTTRLWMYEHIINKLLLCLWNAFMVRALVLNSHGPEKNESKYS